MPIYEYRCANGHTFEVFQNMSDEPVEVCEVCDALVERVFHPVAVHFKGSGFYSTDYAGEAKAASSDGDASDAKDSKKPESKSDSKAESSSGGDSKAGSKTSSDD